MVRRAFKSMESPQVNDVERILLRLVGWSTSERHGSD